MENDYAYYYSDGTNQFGPYAKEVLKTRGLNPETLVWREGLETWIPARTLPELNDLFPAINPSRPPVPPQQANLYGLSSAPQYQQPQYLNPPVIKLRTHRGMLKFVLLSLITLGIYGLVVLSHVSSEINAIATRHDHRHTMHYCLVFFLLSWLTLGIYPLVWWSNICSRMGTELVTRRIKYSFGAGYFWLWNILGSLILVGPFIFTYKFFKSMNLLAKDYNVNG